MSRIHKLIVPIMLTMNLCACGSESIQKGSNIQNFEQNHYITHANTYQNGVIYTGSEGSSTAAYFLDYESMQAVPLVISQIVLTRTPRAWHFSVFRIASCHLFIKVWCIGFIRILKSRIPMMEEVQHINFKLHATVGI